MGYVPYSFIVLPSSAWELLLLQRHRFIIAIVSKDVSRHSNGAWGTSQVIPSNLDWEPLSRCYEITYFLSRLDASVPQHSSAKEFVFDVHYCIITGHLNEGYWRTWYQRMNASKSGGTGPQIWGEIFLQAALNCTMCVYVHIHASWQVEDENRLPTSLPPRSRIPPLLDSPFPEYQGSTRQPEGTKQKVFLGGKG